MSKEPNPTPKHARDMTDAEFAAARRAFSLSANQRQRQADDARTLDRITKKFSQESK